MLIAAIAAGPDGSQRRNAAKQKTRASAANDDTTADTGRSLPTRQKAIGLDNAAVDSRGGDGRHRIRLDPPLIPRDGRTLKVVTVDRVSTKNQDPKANDDQLALVRKWVEDRYDGPIQWTRVTGQGSGECIDRKEVRQAEDLVASRQFDLVIMEDLARHLRRSQAVSFCEDCEDAATRLVAINDAIDTALDWRLHAFFAAIKHEQSNKDTSLRIQRSQRNRFINGEMIQFTIFGYIKPPGAKLDSDLKKDPAAEPIYDEWFRKLEDRVSFCEIADWLNDKASHRAPSAGTRFGIAPWCHV